MCDKPGGVTIAIISIVEFGGGVAVGNECEVGEDEAPF